MHFTYFFPNVNLPPQPGIKPVPPPLYHCCLINYTNRTTSPLYPMEKGSYVQSKISNFFPNINLHLPYRGTNHCLLLSIHAALSTTPIGPPQPLTPWARGHMYITQILNFYPNLNLHLPHHGSNPCFLLSHHTRINFTIRPAPPPYPLEEGSYVLYTISQFFSYHESTLPPPGIKPVPPPLHPCCLINYTNQTSPPPNPMEEGSYVLYAISFF